MKIRSIIVLMLFNGTLHSQSTISSTAMSSRFTRLAMPPDTGRCMTEEQKDRYNKEVVDAKKRWKPIADSIFRTGEANRIDMLNALLSWPMKVSPEYDLQYRFYYKGKFVDQHPGSSSLNDDYNCGNRSYQGHDASDIGIFPFWWRMMDKMYVSAVAAAPGMIIKKEDGAFDRECDNNADSTNRVIVLHANGYTTRYHHLKKYSLTTKDSGDLVETGEFLGYIGSSGNSSQPHLHFALYDSNENHIEPFYLNNSCNNFGDQSWWINQPSYWDPKISRVMTHYQVPVIGFCPDEEKVYMRNQFDVGDMVTVGIAFSEARPNDIFVCNIYKPDGDLYISDQDTVTVEDNKLYLLNQFLLPLGNTGTWKVKVDYRGSSYFHFFTVGCPADVIATGNYAGSNGFIAGSTISTTVTHTITSGDKVLYQAPGSIEFKPGFHAPSGILLRTRLEGCNYGD